MEIGPKRSWPFYRDTTDFQLRPTNPKHLTYALNVLDWPSGDENGQVQRRTGNDSTFADSMTPAQVEADPRAQNGDMRLIPMLEIELSGNTQSVPLPMTTTVRTHVALQGVDTSWPVSTTPPSFTTWLSGTLNFAQAGSNVNVNVQLDGTPTLQWLNIYTGTCSAGGDLMSRLTAGSASNVITNTNLLNLADGNHFVMAASAGHTSACADLIDLPNGPYLDRVVDETVLAPYGISVKDKDRNGTMLAYVPLNVTPDDGGGQAAFSARVLYQPKTGNLGDVAQKVRLVWIVQTLTDWCKPAPDDADLASSDVWCKYEASWNLDNIQFVHTYDDDWQLTGLSVREDHGVNMAVAWEDPAGETTLQRQLDDKLWIVAAGLEEAFIGGRDQDGNKVRDIGVVKTADGETVADTTIAVRFNSPLSAGVTITDRFGLPLTATLHVNNYAYAYQDQVASMMMSGTQQILTQNFNAYTDSTPTLLFAREERFRSVSLEAPAVRSVVTSTVTFDFNGRLIDTTAAMSWAPYRFKDGAWQAYPMNEYWDAFGVRLKSVLPDDPALSAADNESLNHGKVIFARSYYLFMNQGRAALVQIGRDLAFAYSPQQADLTLTKTLMASASGLGGGISAVLNKVVGKFGDELAKLLRSGWDTVAYLALWAKYGFLSELPNTLFRVASDADVSTSTVIKKAVSDLLGRIGFRIMNEMPTSTAGRVAVVGAGVAIGAVLVLSIASVAVGFAFSNALLMISAVVGVALAVVQVSLAIYALYQYATDTLEALSRTAMVCAVIGVIIGSLIAFGCAIATLITGHLKFGSTAANAAFAMAIAYTIVAVIYLVISFIPVVGQIIVAILGAIDALIGGACSIASAVVGYNVKENVVGQWVCKGISGLAAELVKWGIYSSAIMLDLQDANRLQFGQFNYDLVQPEKGLSVNSGVIYRIELTNTIKLDSVLPTTDEVIAGWKSGTSLIPVDWKQMSYFWQYSTKNLKSSTFAYQWQAAKADIDADLSRDTMNDAWSLTGHTNRIGVKDQAYITPTVTSSVITLNEAGINRNPTLYLAEGMAVPEQECFTVYNPPGCVGGFYPYICLVPVCYVRTSHDTNNFDFGQRFTLDVFPATLDEFYAPVAKDGGVSLAWGQAVSNTLASTPVFARQKDFDGDGLLNAADGGADPNDALWDTDGDGLGDGYEIQHGTNPTLADSDGDGLSDAEELRLGTDPNRKDTDGDGLTDYEEVIGWSYVYAITPSGQQLRTWVVSDPLNADEDGDTLSDFKEKAFGFNPHVVSDPQVLTLKTGVTEPAAPRLLLRLDETAGTTTFADASGHGHTAICDLATCPVSGQSGHFGLAPQFSGDALSVAHSELTEYPTNYTVAAWIDPTTVTGQQTILASARTNSNDGFSLGLSNNNLTFSLYGAPTYVAVTHVSANTWTHVAAVVSSNTGPQSNVQVTFYVNGAQAGVYNSSQMLRPDLNDALLVGAETPSGSATLTNAFTGSIDEVAIFNRALSNSDLSSLLNGQYDPDDTYLKPQATVAYTSSIGNKLMDRYAQGLLSLSTTPLGSLLLNMSPQTFVLPPQAQAAFTGTAVVGTAGAISLTQAAQAEITDWRETAGYAQMWLKLDDPITSTTFADSSGQLTPANGQCSGNACPLRQQLGYFDYGVTFNGPQFITLPDTLRLGMYDSSFSVSAWVKPIDVSATRTLLAADRANDANALRMELVNGKPSFTMHTTALTGTQTLRANNWYHVVFRYDKALGEQAIYVNGELQASRLGVTSTLGVSTTAMVLGRGYNNTNFFRGSIDDVRVYQRALDLTEIRTLYNQPVLRLGFEDAPPTWPSVIRTFADSSGFNQQTQCMGNNCPAQVPGIAGQNAANFDGADYLSVQSQPSLNLSDGQFTLAAWVKPIAQGEPINASCNMTATYYNNFSFTGTPSNTLCANWPVASMDADGSAAGTWLVNYQSTTNQWPAGFSGRWTGQFEFNQGTYTFYGDLSQMDAITLTVDNNSIGRFPTGGFFWLPNGKTFNINSTGIHTVTVEVRTRDRSPYVRFGWIPPHVQSIIGLKAGDPNGYPTLQSVARKVRFGFGTSSSWASNTTTETVLTANTWNFVVLTVGPRYNTDGSFDQNVATLYVNNQVKANWGFGSSKPSNAATSFDVGRATTGASIYVDHFKVTNKADESPHAEIYLNWNDNKICVTSTDTGDANGDSCIWGGLSDNDVRNVYKVESLGGSGGELRAWEADNGAEAGHNYGDDPLCDVGSGACTAGYTFKNTQVSIPFTHLFDWQGDNGQGDGLNGEDQTRISLYVGDSTHWAYRNPSTPVKAQLDDVTLYKRPLSADEVQELYLSASAALYLKLDDAPGSQSFENSVDVSKQSNAFCTGTACPTAGVSGRMNQATLFNGSSNILSTTLLLDESPASPGATLMGWVKPSSTSTGRHDVFSTDSASATGGNQWSIVRDGNEWKITNGQSLIATGATVDANQWQHVAAVFIPRTGIKFYKNGTLITTLTPIVTSAANAPLAIGGAWSSNYFDGAIDDVRVFASALTDANIQTLWQAAPVWQLHLDEAAATTTFADAAGNNPATCSGAACPNTGVAGQVSLGAEFNLNDGVSDQLTVADDNALDVGQFTIGAWVLPSVILTRSQTLIDKGSNFRLSIAANDLTPTLSIATTPGCATVTQVSAATALIPNQWNHVMGLFDGSALQIYVNGYLQGSTSVSGSACTNASNLLIGNTADSRFFAGRLDEVTLYNHALLPTDIRDTFWYQGKLVEERSTQTLIVDNDNPTSQVQLPTLPYVPGGAQLLVTAHDASSPVSMVELHVDQYHGTAAWQPAPQCMDAVGDSAWCPYFTSSGEGEYRLQTRATDAVGHQATSGVTSLYVDTTLPTLGSNLSSGALVSALPDPAHENAWIVQLSGTAIDSVIANSGYPGSGVVTDSVRITLVDATGAVLGQERQGATLTGATWNINYAVPEARPTGAYTIRAEAIDRVGNVRTATDLVTIQIDATAPTVDLNSTTISGAVVTNTQAINGVISEVPTPRSPALLMHFEEAANARTFADNSGWVRNGVCVAATCPTSNVAGQYGSAVQFNGTHVISIAHSALNETANGFSIAAWVNPATLNGTQRLIAAARTRSNDGFSLGLNGSSPQFSAFGGNDFNFNAPLTVNTWTHVAAVVASDNSISLYVNGTLRGTITSTVPITPDLDDVLMLGGTTTVLSTTLTEAYSGKLDELIIVNRALAADEIRALAQPQTAGVANVQVAYQSNLPGSPFYNEPTPAGEVLHLALEDRPDQNGLLNFVDASGLNHTGACQGAACPTTQQTGHIGNAAKFDGAQNKISVNSFGTPAALTFAGWVYQSSASAQTGYLINACFGGLSVNNRVPKLEVRFSNGTSRQTNTSSSIPLNEWVFLAATYDAGWLYLYQNGTLIGSIYQAGTLKSCSTATTIGDGLVGSLDDVRLFNRALSAAELKVMYFGANPIVDLPFDEPWLIDGATTIDASDWRHNGTYHSNNVNGLTPIGQVGAHALALDGNSDYVSIAPQSGLDLSGGRFSIGAWIYPSPQDNNPYPIISSVAYNAVNSAYPFLHVINRTQLQGGFGTGGALKSVTTGSVLTENAWNHVAATFDGTTYTLYVNGTPQLITTTLQGNVPAATQQFDIGRGAAASASGCARITNLTLTPGATPAQRVKVNGTPVFTITTPTPNAVYTVLSNTDLCGSMTVAVDFYIVSSKTWSQYGATTLNAAPGSGSASFVLPVRGSLNWSMTLRPGDVRYWRGQLDEVRVYPRALLPAEVQALAQTRWLPGAVANLGSSLSAWNATVPAGLEGSYNLDVRGADAAGHVNSNAASSPVWSGEIDTLAPRVSTTRTAVSGGYRYTTTAEDYNLSLSGFTSPCGAGVVTSTEYYQTPWYRALAGSSGNGRVYRLSADCVLSNPGLFEPGTWLPTAGGTTSTLLTGRVAVSGTQVYVANGGLLQIDASSASQPRYLTMYDANGDARGVVISGTYAYIADGSFGLTSIDLRSPTAPLGRKDTPGTALDVARWGNYAYVADGSGGLRVMDVTSPTNPVEVSSLATSGDALAVAMAGTPGVLMQSVTESEPVTSSTVTDAVNVTPQPTDIPPANLSNEEWTSIQNQIEQANATVSDGLMLQATKTLSPSLANAYFGNAAVVDGDTMVVGASSVNAAYVFTRHSGGDNQWGLSATLVPTDVVPGDNFGSAVAINGDWLAVSAPNATYSGITGNGRVYLYQRNQGGADAWGLMQNINYAGSTNDQFGYALTLDGDVLIASALNAGRAVVYSRSIFDWTQRNIITVTSTADNFGYALALVGDTLAIGAPLADVGNNTDAGATYIYTRSFVFSADEWTPVITLTASDGAMNDHFGSALSVSGDRVLVGAPQAAISGRSQQGAAYLFTRNQGGANAWGQVKKIISTDGAASDTFGNSLALDDDRALIGADSFSSGRGKAYTFERNEGGVDNWGQRRIITLTGGLDAAPAFGHAVALNRDTVLITANNQDTLVANDNRGAAYVYALRGDTWLPQTPITPTGLTTDENFGGRAALSGDTLVVGAPNRNGFTNSAVYIFQRNQNGAEGWGLVKRLAGPASSEFGYAVAIDGDTLVVGAPNADTTVWMTVTNSGVAFVYDRNLGGANNWGESGQLPMAGSPHSEYIATGDRWGTTVAVDGDLIVIGSTTLNRVRTYVRRPFGDTIWWAMGGIDTPQANHFGSGLSLSGDILAVGADDNVAGPGAVYIYNRDYNPGPWVLSTTLMSVDAIGLGSEVMLDSSTLAVVAHNPIVTTTAQIRLYDRNAGGADNWGLVITLPVTTSVGLQLQQDMLAIALSDQTQIRSRHQGGLNQWGVIQTLPITNAYGLALAGDTLAFGYPDAHQKAEVYRLAARPSGTVDAYNTIEHGTLNVAAPGVLGNDLSARGTLTATVNTTPTHGTLTLNANGSFTYALGSTNHYTGTDTFTYRASDGTLTSNPITVTITITPVNDPPTIDPIADVVLQPNAAQQTITLTGLGPGDAYEHEAITITAQSTNTVLIPNPIVSYANPNVTGTLRFTPATNQTGLATIVVTVTDGLTNTVRQFTVNVWPLSGPFAYVALGNSGLSIINLTNPAQPQPASVIDTPGFASDVVVSGTYAYVADGSNGLVIVNVNSPLSPQIVGRRATAGNASGVVVIGRYAYVADGYAGVTMIDVLTPTAPTLVSTTNTPGYAGNITTNGRYLYVTDKTGGLRIFDTQAPTGQAAACDSSGNCTTTTAPALLALDYSAVIEPARATDAANASVAILDAPLVLTNTDALTITGKAATDLSSLQALTITVDGSVIDTQNWATEAVSETVWTTLWNPTGLSDGAHEIRADVSTWAGDLAKDVFVVTVDTLPPQISLDSHVLLGEAYHAPGQLDISGLVTDTAGVQAVQVIFNGDTYNTLLDGKAWHALVSVNQLPDGETYSVTLQALDIGGHVTQVADAIIVDAAPPTNVDLMLSEGGNSLAPGTTIRTLSPTLTLDWTPATDGSGVQSYLIDWTTVVTDTYNAVQITQYPTRTSTYQPGEGQSVWASLDSIDVYGQSSSQTTGPIYIDAPRTPDYVALNYSGWQDSGCSLIGVDRRIARSTNDKVALSAEQRFFATWSNDNLRLAWTGANWDEDGELFIYLDTQPGGTTTAFNPFIDTTPDTVIHLPGVTPTSTVSALAADYLIWVRDANTALLLQWQGTDWEYVETLSADQYLYRKDVNDGQTDLSIPFNSIGITSPDSAALQLVAFATEESALRLWAVMPNANPVNSDQVVATGIYAGGVQTFALSRAYQWSNVGAGVCPNGSDGTSQTYSDVDAHVSLRADPIGAGYSLLDDNLFWLWNLLAGDRTADVTSAFNFMSADHPRVGANQTITYALEYRNDGTATAHNVEADLSALFTLQLNGPSTLVLGDVAPGQIVTATFSAHINLSASPLAWAAVAVNVYDAGHPRSGEPLDRLWVDHQVDRSAPEFLGLFAPDGVIAPQRTTLTGYSYDESAIPLLTMNVSGQSPINCLNAVSAAGQWSCVLDATGHADGDVLNLSLQATDIYGQMSTATNPQPLIIDAVPPTVTIDLAQNQIVNGSSLNVSGSATDNHGLDHVEVCADDAACSNAPLQLADGATTQVFDDTPEGGLVIDGSTTCGSGEIVRTFNVAETFAIGSVRVGLNATHADRDEMRVDLSAPSGTSVRLLADDGLSGTHLQNYAVMLSDAASQSYANRSDDDVTRGFDRLARPYQPLRAFNGQTSAGTWTLRICDTNPAANDGQYQRSQLILEPQAALQLAHDGQWSYMLSISNQEDYVAHTISVYGIDRAGNRTAQPTHATFIVDNVAPVMTVTQLIATAPLTHSLPVLNIAATDGSGVAQVLVLVDAPNTTYATLATRDGAGWHFDLDPSLIGTYRLWISAYDNAGNVASSGAYQVNVTGPLPYTTFLPIVAYNYVNRPYVVLLPVITRNYAASQTRR